MKADDKTALITGAAARIGAAVASALHARGCNVLIHYGSNRAAAGALVGRLNDIRPESASAVGADLSVAGGPEQLVSACMRHTERLDVLEL